MTQHIDLDDLWNEYTRKAHRGDFRRVVKGVTITFNGEIVVGVRSRNTLILRDGTEVAVDPSALLVMEDTP